VADTDVTANGGIFRRSVSLAAKAELKARCCLNVSTIMSQRTIRYGIDVFVDELDLGQLEFEGIVPHETGRQVFLQHKVRNTGIEFGTSKIGHGIDFRTTTI
jgi:hypothetical protein